MTTPARKFMTGVACAAAFAISLTGCAANGDAGADSAKGSDTVTLVVHDSFPNEDFAKAASAATGYEVQVVSAGDGGELTSQLVLTQSAPIADAFFGVDNVYLSRLIDGGVARVAEYPQFAAHTGQWLVEGVGVAPDIEVDNLPHETFLGTDRQLDAAIAHLRRKLQSEPIQPLKPAAIPPLR